MAIGAVSHYEIPSMRAFVLSFSVLAVVLASGACGDDNTGGGGSSSSHSSSSTGPLPPAGPFCDLPGSVRFTGSGTVTVPGGKDVNKLTFLSLPAGFCAHAFGTVPNARQLRFAPGGELFVASPTATTTGGGPGGQNAIVVLADDNGDGIADAPITFMGNLPSTQGLMFAPGFFYYQDGTKIMRVPYASGDRAPKGASELVADITIYSSPLHWPKTFDMADDGTIFVGNGGDQGEVCDPAHPFHGGILKLDGSPGGTPVAKGLRNPINIRCSRGHDLCFAAELAKDYSATTGGREKLIPIRQGDDWGFPCCATKDLPYVESPPGTDCSTVTPEDVGFFIGDTPFGIAFTPSSWPAAWQNHALVATHGAAGTWTGARVVSVALDPTTGLPLPGSNTGGKDTGSLVDFATGWDDGTRTHGRPAAVEVAADGRLFVADDTTGFIFWIAPMTM
jgi:glucose/arabinose dehydrogenase